MSWTETAMRTIGVILFLSGAALGLDGSWSWWGWLLGGGALLLVLANNHKDFTGT